MRARSRATAPSPKAVLALRAGGFFFGLLTIPAAIASLLLVVGLAVALRGPTHPADDWPSIAFEYHPPALLVTLTVLYVGVRSFGIARASLRGEAVPRKRLGFVGILFLAFATLFFLWLASHAGDASLSDPLEVLIVPFALATCSAAYGVLLLRSRRWPENHRSEATGGAASSSGEE